jgi:hypothetical protein
MASGIASASSRIAGITTKRTIPGRKRMMNGSPTTTRPTLRSITSSSILPNVGRWAVDVGVICCITP